MLFYGHQSTELWRSSQALESESTYKTPLETKWIAVYLRLRKQRCTVLQSLFTALKPAMRSILWIGFALSLHPPGEHFSPMGSRVSPIFLFRRTLCLTQSACL
ncbi:hypothetical protein HDN1F_35430 [gamma proteobacterium HdN1]|nr:Hypothetical protein HDN1F_17760 [gamma proteobacterium HdN1]CBL47126.1 hypothetical protein HDN1F_35430 [gamma proteobacterium HdN1]